MMSYVTLMSTAFAVLATSLSAVEAMTCKPCSSRGAFGECLSSQSSTCDSHGMMSAPVDNCPTGYWQCDPIPSNCYACPGHLRGQFGECLSSQSSTCDSYGMMSAHVDNCPTGYWQCDPVPTSAPVVPSAKDSYLGCYDSRQRQEWNWIFKGSVSSADECAAACHGVSFFYSLECPTASNKAECSCVNAFLSDAKLQDGNCNGNPGLALQLNHGSNGHCIPGDGQHTYPSGHYKGGWHRAAVYVINYNAGNNRRRVASATAAIDQEASAVLAVPADEVQLVKEQSVRRKVASSTVCNGWSVTEVYANDHQNVYFQEGDKQWVEFDAVNGFHYFQETHRDEWSVYLFDAGRNVRLQLDLHLKQVFYTDASTSRREQYPIDSFSC